VIGVTIRIYKANSFDTVILNCRKKKLLIFTFVEEEYDAEIAVNTKPKMSWDEEDSDDNTNEVKESWDDSEEEEVPVKTTEKKTETVAPPVKKNLTLKQKIAEKEAALKEQRAKKIALVREKEKGSKFD
jgi:translation initiation factor 3 subunit J